MKSFLHQIAETYYLHHREEISSFCFVFPNRRAALFFQKELANISPRPIFSPTVTTISDFIINLSPYQTVDRIDLLFKLYGLYKELINNDEEFDDFVFWGEMLLNDFDDVDKNMINAEQLFSNLRDIKDIEDNFEYLTEEQIAAIKHFWHHFIPPTDKNKEDFIKIWEILLPLYNTLREELHNENLAYQGMAYRYVATEAQKEKTLTIPYPKVIFVGLNALTHSEEVILTCLKNNKTSDFYWDAASPIVMEEHNKASYFMQKQLLLFPSQYPIEEEIYPQPSIEVIGIPSSVGQTKETYTILQKLLQTGAITSPDKAINTAIILPNEQLLLPTLYGIPQEINPINITMGYTLRNTQVAALVEAIADLHNRVRYQQGNAQFYHRNVLTLLSHPYLNQHAADKISNLIEDIKRHNRIFLDPEALKITPLLSQLFVQLDTGDQVPDYLLKLIDTIQQQSENDEQHTLSFIEREFLYHYYITVKRLKEVITHHDIKIRVDTFFSLLTRMTASISIPFRGEPLSGLQIMGVLETRAIDFENIIILSMNEGVFPKRDTNNSFIPYTLRKGFGLFTYEHQDSISAYYFYRLIYRAKRVFLLYDTRTEGLQTGEMSRFIYQLKYLYKTPINERIISYNMESIKHKSITVKKNTEIIQQLQQYLTPKSGKTLSASSINNYLNCPLKFYMEQIEGLNEEEEVEEKIESGTFGTIFHYVMELIYHPFEGKMVTADLLEKVDKNEKLLTEYIEEAFNKYYFNKKHRSALTGQNYLNGEIIRKYVKQVLKQDRKLTPFVYVESEKKLLDTYQFSENKIVNLKGSIDRIDRNDQRIRIIDYKTGKAELTFKTMEQLFDKTMDNRPSAIMQVLLYALLYNQEVPSPVIEPGIYRLNTLYKDKFESKIYGIIDKEDGEEAIENYHDLAIPFKEELNKCLQEIFDEKIPFSQTEQTKTCTYCSFSKICNRTTNEIA